ncbi:MAG: efflux RND transporter permease subunit [Kangiellaceae bacterium]|jgi:cobalt-zinc-cadmium resistance protein CzcA|nr:efflux RND transporter permease subunit [Kangiellaceae bacterium]
MIARIIQFSLVQRLFVVCAFLVTTGLGIKAWYQLPIDAFPDISPVQVSVIIKARGMTAEEVEAQITQPIEVELLGIPNQTILRSTTKYAISSITIDFSENTDIYWARQQVSSRLAAIRDKLPDNATGGVAPMSTPLSEMFMFTVENPALTLQQRKHILDWQIRPALRTLSGVADVNVLGGYTKIFQFTPKLEKLVAYQLSLEQLVERLKSVNINGSIGRINAGADALVVRTQGRATNFEQLSKLVITSFKHQAVTLEDLGELTVGSLTRYGGVTRNGEESTQGLVVALKGSNTAVVVENVMNQLNKIQSSLPDGTKINIFYNRKDLIDTAVGTITSALTQAIVIVILLLAFFLGNIRASIVIALAIPVVVLLTFLTMQLTNLTANLMSLGGLVIAIGMLVDASVVVVENTVTKLTEGKSLPRLHLVYRATRTVAKPVIAGTLIVIVVFMPLLSLEGLEGKLFSPVAATIVYAMIASIIAAFTIIPVVASYLLSSNNNKVPKYLVSLQGFYTRSLQWVIRQPRYIISFALLSLVASGLLFTQVGKTFMPVMNEGDIIVQLEKTPSISLLASLKLDMQVERFLLKEFPEIIQIVARTGSDELGLDPMGLNETDVFMQLAPIDTWRFDSKAQLENAIRDKLKEYRGINIGFTQPIQMRVSEMLTGSTGMLAVKIYGSDIKILSDLANKIAQVVSQQAGAVDTNTTLIEGGDFLNVVPKSAIALEYGMSMTELANYLRMQVTGLHVGDVINGRVRTPIYFGDLQKGQSKVSAPEVFGELLVFMPNGIKLPLSAIADVTRAEGPSVIEREQGLRFSVVSTNVEGLDLGSFVQSVQVAIAEQIDLPAGYIVEYGGEFENQIRASNNLIMLIPAVVIIILIILFTLFHSLSLAGLIIANVPFALMGGIFALAVTGEYLSVPASVGFIALLGVSVLNGVVMVSYYEDLKCHAYSLADRVVIGAQARLRPILMTATTAMFGLLPLAFATGPGAEVQKPLAIVVIGGLITSTLITLYVLPIGYQALERRK